MKAKTKTKALPFACGPFVWGSFDPFRRIVPIKDDRDHTVACVLSGPSDDVRDLEKWASQLVVCLNTHGDLLAACEEMLCYEQRPGHFVPQGAAKAAIKMRASIAAAKGERRP